MVDVAPRYDLVVTSDLQHIPSGWQMLKGLVYGEKAKVKFPNIMEILIRTMSINSIARGSDSGSIANLAYVLQ